MAITMKKAKRSLARIKIAVGGVSGSGKTMSSLLMAYGLVKEGHQGMSDAEIWDKICIIDTENSSGSLYVNAEVNGFRIGEYNAIDLEPPFEAQRYIDAIHVAERAGIEVLIIDSLSHAWSGEGGALEKQQKIASRSGNSYTAWREPKQEQRKLMDTILQSPCHVIAGIRAKREYAQQKDANGKTVVKSMGMGLITSGESEYEWSILFMLDNEHVASAEKDRTGLFDGKLFTITPETGSRIYKWLAQGSSTLPPVSAPAPAPAVAPAVAPAPPAQAEIPADQPTQEGLADLQTQATTAIKDFIKSHAGHRDEVIAKVKEIANGEVDPRKITDLTVLVNLINTFGGENA